MMCRLSISYGDDLARQYNVKFYDLNYPTFEELKQGVLKRWGNIVGSNKAEKERMIGKRIIWNAKNMGELINGLKKLKRWEFNFYEVKIKIDNERASNHDRKTV